MVPARFFVVLDLDMPALAPAFGVSVSRINTLILFLVLIMIGPRPARAQEPTARNELWPEIDVYIHITPKVRLFMLGTVSKAAEDGELRDAKAFESQVGIHVDYIPNQHLILRTGYRYGTSVGDTEDPFKEHRLVTEQTLRQMLAGGLLISDRNREDFRFRNGDFSFRYRNRVTLEREFHIFKRRTITPYGSAEIFYDTRYDAWNRNHFAGGVQVSLRAGPLRKMLTPRREVIFDLYYMRLNDSRSDIRHVNAIGTVLVFHF